MTIYNLGLTGYPLEHSFSPRLHRAALQAAGLQGDYCLYPIRPLPAGEQELSLLLERVRSGTIRGLNVTIPHKQAVLSYLDRLTAAAEAIGAANTIWAVDGTLWGDNTDAPGFLDDLRHFMGDGYGRLTHALVLGAGGSARAIAFALAADGRAVTLAARRLAQAQALVKTLQPAVPGALGAAELAPQPLQKAIAAAGLLINTTPVGMSPRVDASPWPDKLLLPPETAVYDLVYNPPITKLVQAARNGGNPATTGLGMLIGQAALAFKRWTGREVPREVWANVVI